MTGHRQRRAVFGVFSQPRAEDHDARQSDDAAHGVNDAGTGEIDRSVPQFPVDAHLSQPAAAPNPIGINAVGQRHPKSVEAEVLPSPTFGHAPVGIVAVVSMNTIMKKNRAITLTSSTPLRKKPFRPIRPYLYEPAAASATPKPQPLLSTAVPGPSDEYQPGATGPLTQLPQPMAKP